MELFVLPERMLETHQHHRLLQHLQRQFVRVGRETVPLLCKLHGRIDLSGGILRRQLVVTSALQRMSSRQVLRRRTWADDVQVVRSWQA